jgi:predicted permease
VKSLRRIPTLASVWRHFFRRQREERDLDDEIASAVELLVEEKVAAGMTAEEARRAAAIELGGPEQVKEAVRDVRPGRLLEQTWQDLRYAARGLAKSPTFTAVAVLTLALGIGANSAIFSVLDAVLIRPLPYARPDRLVMIWSEFRSAGQKRVPSAGPQLTEIARRTRLFQEVAGVWVGRGALAGDGEPEQVRVGNVTANFLSIFGVAPGAGRLFARGDEGHGSSPNVIISDGLWRRRFGADPSVIGRTLRLDGEPHTVVGVMPQGFQIVFPADASVPSEIDVWRPFLDDLSQRPRGLGFLRLIGRLRPGVTLDQAQSELDSIATALRASFSEYATPDLRTQVTPLQRDSVREVRPILLALFGGVAIVTLIACANVANLLLARATRREREISLRAALGAGRGRIARQLLTESLLLAGLGGLVGIGIGWAGVHLLLGLRPVSLARIQSAGLSGSVLAFTLVLTALVGILAGLAPVIASARSNLLRGFQDRSGSGAPGRSRAQKALVLAEVALGFVLVAGSGLMVRTFVGLLHADPGFDAAGALTFQVGSPSGSEDDASAQRFFRDLQTKLERLPGVTAVGAVSHLPLDDYPNWYEYYWNDGAPATERNKFLADHRAVLPGFFRSARIALLAGRDFTALDGPDRPNVVVVDESLARREWPGESPLGKRLTATFLRFGSFEPKVAEVIGVVRHARYHALAADGRGQIYVPYLQSARENLAFVVRTDADPLALARPVREAAASLDPEVAISKMRPFSAYVDSAREATRFTTAVAGVLAGIALLLAFVGIYGVVSCSVAARTAEIGVRMALGGRPRNILWLVLGQTLRITGIGLAAGAGASLLLTGLIAKLLYGVGPRDPLTLAASALILAVAGIVAAVLPARRAMSVDPVIALRHEA